MHSFREPIRPLCVTHGYVGPTRSRSTSRSIFILTPLSCNAEVCDPIELKKIPIQVSDSAFSSEEVSGIFDTPLGPWGTILLSVLDIPVVRLGPINRPACPVKVGLTE